MRDSWRVSCWTGRSPFSRGALSAVERRRSIASRAAGAGLAASGLVAALSVFVPFARWYVGAHLPLDTAGGSALGTAIGSAVNLALGVPEA